MRKQTAYNSARTVLATLTGLLPFTGRAGDNAYAKEEVTKQIIMDKMADTGTLTKMRLGAGRLGMGLVKIIDGAAGFISLGTSNACPAWDMVYERKKEDSIRYKPDTEGVGRPVWGRISGPIKGVRDAGEGLGDVLGGTYDTAIQIPMWVGSIIPGGKEFVASIGYALHPDHGGIPPTFQHGLDVIEDKTGYIDIDGESSREYTRNQLTGRREDEKGKKELGIGEYSLGGTAINAIPIINHLEPAPQKKDGESPRSFGIGVLEAIGEGVWMFLNPFGGGKGGSGGGSFGKATTTQRTN